MKEDIEETRFTSGLTILTDRMPGVRSVTLGFFYRVGARHEPVELKGISHFIEHTVFKGTGRRSALDIAIEQDRLGGGLDAFTTHEETGFAIKVIDDQLEHAFDLLADMMNDPRFDDAELESEQRVIIEEIKMLDDSPEELLGEIFTREYFADHPLGLSIAGTPETVRTFDHKTTAAFHREMYHAGNLVITAAGNVHHEQIVGLAEKHFGKSEIRNPQSAIEPPSPAAPIVIRRKPDLEQAHLIIATPFVAATDRRRYAADLLSGILGGGMSSRLWQKIREERGLAYSVGTSAAMYLDCGVFSIFAGTSPEQTDEVIDISIGELRNVVRSGVDERELELAKAQARASVLLSLEDSAARAASMAQSEMVHGRQISVEETLANIDAVTTDEVAAIARDFFKTESIAFGALGDLDGLTVKRERLAV
ncbi:MAG: M16 family metallopeptidase [Pyrinomonadaceae bacterium]